MSRLGHAAESAVPDLYTFDPLSGIPLLPMNLTNHKFGREQYFK